MADLVAWTILLALFAAFLAVCAWNPFAAAAIGMLAGLVGAIIWECWIIQWPGPSRNPPRPRPRPRPGPLRSMHNDRWTREE